MSDERSHNDTRDETPKDMDTEISSQIQRAKKLAGEGNLEDALREFEDVIEREPNLSESHKEVGKILFHLNRLEEAKTRLKKAIEIEPTDFEIHLTLADVFVRLQQDKEAEDEFIEAIKIAPNYAEAYFRYGYFLDSRGRRADAYDMLAKGIELDPRGDNGLAMYTCGFFEYELSNRIKSEDRELAEKHYMYAVQSVQEAIAINPTDSRYYVLLGDIHKELFQNEEAAESYKRAVTVAPDNEEVRFKYAQFLGFCLGKWGEAEREFRDLISHNPNDWRFHKQLSFTLYVQKRYEESISSIREAIRIIPEEPILHFALAEYLVDRETPRKLRNRDEAKKEYEKALHLFRLKGDEEMIERISKKLKNL